MENKNGSIIIGLLSLIVGLFVGYMFGINTTQAGFWMGGMHADGQYMYEEMGEHMYGGNHHMYGGNYEDAEIRQDGAMQHAMDEMMLGLRGETGEDFEEAFLRGMIVHHLGAVRMSERLLEETDRPELTQFANDIISVQQQEIEQMRTWLDDWFGN